VLAGGVLLAALCLFGFTIAGSILVERLTWLKPVAGVVLVLIGGKLAFEHSAGVPTQMMKAEIENRAEGHHHEGGEAEEHEHAHPDSAHQH